MAYSASSNKKSWGLTVPGRPPTPSEGAAQQYSRFGPPEGQRLATFANGTCLEYGPNDPIDEFNLNTHPFSNQVALVDSAIKDIKAVREGYHEARSGNQRHASASGQSSDADSESSTPEEDPFNNFRVKTADETMVQHIKLESGTYVQVPSRYGTVTNMVSIYSHPNKSDAPGLGHPGLVDSRFGRSARLEAHHSLQIGDDMTRHTGGHGQSRRDRRRQPRKFPPHTDGNGSEEEDSNARQAHNPNDSRTHRSGNSDFHYHHNSRSGNGAPSNQPNDFRPWQPATNNGRHHNSNNHNFDPGNQPYARIQRPSNTSYYNGSTGNAGPAYQPNRYPSEVRDVGLAYHPSSSQQRPVHQSYSYPPDFRNAYPPYQPSGSQPVPGNTAYYNSFGNLIATNTFHNMPQYNTGPLVHGTGSEIGERTRNRVPPQPTVNRAQGLQVQGFREHANSSGGLVPASQPNPLNSNIQSGMAAATIRHPSPPDLSIALNRLDNNLASQENWDYFRSVAERYSIEYFDAPNQEPSATSEELPSLPNRETTGPPASFPTGRQMSTSPSSVEDEQGPPTPPHQMPLLEFNRAWEHEFGQHSDDFSHQHTPRAFQESLANGNDSVEVPRTPWTRPPMARTPEPYQLPDGSIPDLEGLADPGGFWIPGPGGMIARELEPEDFGFPRGSMDGVRNPGSHWDADEFGAPGDFQFSDDGGHPEDVGIVDHTVAGGRVVNVPGWFNPPNTGGHLQGPVPPPPPGHDPSWARAEYWAPPGHPAWRPGGWPMAAPMATDQTHQFALAYNQPHQPTARSGYTSTQPSFPPREGPRDRARSRLVLRSPNHPVRRITLRSPIAFNPTASFPRNMNTPFQAIASNRQSDMASRIARINRGIRTVASLAAAAGSSGDNRGMYPANSIFGEEPGTISQPTSPTVQSARAVRARRQRLYEQSRASSPGTGPSHARGATPGTVRRPASSSDARQG